MSSGLDWWLPPFTETSTHAPDSVPDSEDLSIDLCSYTGEVVILFESIFAACPEYKRLSFKAAIDELSLPSNYDSTGYAKFADAFEYAAQRLREAEREAREEEARLNLLYPER
jgi:hypothetical protein